MASHGFVYILSNPYMPDVFKIGCTERSPHARAEELSKSTGVPAPFKVLCYVEVADCYAFEKTMHEWCKDYRISANREFFEGGLKWFISLMFHTKLSLAFTAVNAFDLSLEYDIDLECLASPWAKQAPPIDASGSPEEIAADAINSAKKSTGFKD